ncbi:MAG: DUF6305 family protein [Synergistaceae bacterium]|nr:DUF6305 family protein [Synergistaceae bacterium]
MKLRYLTIAVLMLFYSISCAWGAEIALTSIGQSSDAMMVKLVLRALKITPDYDSIMQPEALGSQKVLIMVVGGSSKGLGAAGIDKDDEIKRMAALCKIAEKKKIKLLMMHVGGEGRRGTLSDFFIKETIPHGDALILVDGANKDGLFDKLVEAKKAKILTAPNVNGTKAPLQEILSGWGVTR